MDLPLATVKIALDGDGYLFVTMTRGALDEFDLKPGVHVFALFKTTALDERNVATAQP